VPLFGKKVDVQIEVDRTEVVAGEDVRVWAEMGELDKKTQGARIELGYRNTYKEDDTDSDGDRTTRTRTDDVVVATEQVQVGAGSSPGRVEAVFTVPPDAPGSAHKSVAWFVRAVVDRKLARDANAESPLTVLAPLAPLASWAETPPEPASKCVMEITASSRTVKPGDTITGRLTLSPNDEIKVRAVRVQLRRQRNDPDRNTDEDDSTRVPLSGELELVPGASQTFDFSIGVPVDAPPSFRAKYNLQHWFLEGVLDVKRWSDPTTRLEVVVHTA